jgi:phosphoserine phosphatase RsbU/P
MTEPLLDAIGLLVHRTKELEPLAAIDPTAPLADVRKLVLAATHLGELSALLKADPAYSSTGPLTRVARHDLLNGLGQISGYGELLVEEAQDQGLVAVDARITAIVQAAKDLVAVVSGAPADSDSADASPRRTTHGVGPAPAPALVPLRSTNPVLVVDDDELNRALLTTLMRRHGLEVIEAEDGLTAVQTLEHRAVDLILLDVMMPNLDGYGVLERINANPALRDIPVLMISGFSGLENVVRCIEMGAADYLPKPVNPVLLRARVGACLEKKASRDREQRTLRALKESQENLAAELVEAERYVRSQLAPPVAGVISIDWRFLPSTHLGGDSLGHHWLDSDHLALFVLDVCGHGVGAALLSVSVAHVLRSGALPDTDFHDPSQVLAALNDAFQMDQHNNQYFTTWYGVYHKTSRRLRYACGGHPPAIVVDRTGERLTTRRLGHPGLIVGAMPGASYDTSETEMDTGARLYLFSDGAYEITRSTGELLSLDAFEAMILEMTKAGPNILDRLIGQLHRERGEVTFEDDVSVVEITFG